MARPRGGTKTSRLAVNLDERAYEALLAVAGREDAQVAWRAVVDFLSREEPSFGQPNLSMTAGPENAR